MKKFVVRSLSALAIATSSFSLMAPAVHSQISVGVSTPIVSNAGTSARGEDHFVEVSVNGDMPLSRLKVVCVTFHKLSGVKVLDADTGAEIPASVDFGFEEFNITFDTPVAAGTDVRIVMEDSRVRGRKDGLTVPYRIFATYPEIGGEIPIGTALIRIPEVTSR
ncbi:MAG: hypothetical protein AAGD25_27665 [Cyanobacteria bacterium P01_F01_bin.150]